MWYTVKYDALCRCIRRRPVHRCAEKGGNSLKRLFCALAAVLALAMCAAPAIRAQAAGAAAYSITSFEGSAVLHENAVLDVTETIVVDFSSPSHGIYRALQTSLVQEKTTGGETVQMPYKARVTDVQVDGVPFETFTEDGVFFIRIGDEDETVTGTQVYTLHYSYDFGADRVPEYDEFTYSPIGANWEVPIQKASWRVQFEKPLPDSAVQAFTAQAQQAVSVTVSQDAASFVCGQPIQPGQDIVLSTILPEGYFTGARQAPWAAAAVLLGLAAAVAAAALARALAAQRTGVSPQLCTAPPRGVSAAEVGYIVDSCADDRDLFALVYEFAQQGLLSIEMRGSEKAPEAVLHKEADIPETAPDYQRTFFHALFRNRKSFSFAHADERFAQGLAKAKTQLAQHFDGENKLYQPGTAAASLALPLLAAGLFLAGMVLAGGLLLAGGTVLGAASGVCALGAALVAHFGVYRWRFASRGTRLAFSVGAGLLWLGAAVCAFFTSITALLPMWAVLGAAALVLAAAVLAPRILKPTAYNNEVSAQLLGLREYIEQDAAAGGRLTPDQGWALLPYAYVFGMTEEFCARFEADCAPEWYLCAWGWGLHGPAHMGRAMHEGFNTAIREAYAAQAHSSGSGGGSSSGGGFSSGSFGGGGGGAW